ncbi:retrovirus-related Pol polyprotein from transposon 412 [Trichonephila clavipes]|nr:retrovirus-related Pol polyprotein from transposon 412 [Trichonephila clavipes]
MYDERASTEIHTDASGYGIGAVLVQIPNNVEKVIAYASRTLTKAEKIIPPQKGNVLPSDPSGRLARWALRLQEHDFDVKYKTGKKHSDADALSRNPVEEETETSDKFLAVTTSMNLAMEQKKDQDLAKLKLLSNSSKNEEFRFIDGILCRKNFDPDGKLWLPVIPKHLRADILRHFHDAPTAGHLGFSRKLMTGYARDFTGRECTEMSFVPIPPAIAPFHRIGIDLLGRFPKSAHGNKWIIVCTDYSTRYAITKALPTAEVDEIAKFLLEEIVLRHGAPRVIITDRGAVFRSRLVSSLVDLCNIDHRFTTAYHPQTNGLTERFNKTLADMLSMYVDVEQKNWDEILPFVTFAYNTAKQETTGFTPFYLLHGREAETTLDTMLPFCPNDFDDNNITKIAARAEESRQLARVHTLRAQDKDRRRYDSKHQMVSYAPEISYGFILQFGWKRVPINSYPKNPKDLLKKRRDGDRFNSCQVIYSQFGLAIHQNDHQARRRFVEWAQNEIAVVPDFHKRILLSDEAHFWLNGYVNKQNCRIWSEANPQVATITNFFIPELNNHDVQELWFQQDGATCHTARATIDLLKDTFGDRLISRFGPVNWPPRSCDLTPLDYFLWGYVKSLVYADKPQTLDHLEDNIRRVIANIRPQMLEKVIENWTSRLDYIRASRGSPMPEIIFKM